MNVHVKDTAMGRIRTAGIIVAVALAAIAAWAGRYEMTHDGMAYLDMSQAVLRHDWARAINGHWSPLYPWLLALSLSVLKPSLSWVVPAVHVVNLVMFLVSLVCFDFFLRQLIRYRKAHATPQAEERHREIPDWAVVAIGYTLFTWASHNLIGLAFVAPDFPVAACVYLSAGWLLRSQMEPERWSPYVILGFALGLGYLAKAPMLPLGLIFLALVVIPKPRNVPLPRILLRAGVTLVVFSLVAGTLVLAFFETKGRLMLGDSAWLNYAWHVNRIPLYHYQGDRPGFSLVHPTRRISAAPEAYEFATPIEATYAPWFDPAYWYHGLRPRFDLKGHLITARWSLRIYDAEATLYHWWPSAALLVLVGALLVRNGWLGRSDLETYARLWVPALVALAMYAFIHLEARYIAPFMPLLWLGVVSGIRLPVGAPMRTAAVVLAVVLLMHLVPTSILAAQEAYSIGREMVVPGMSRGANRHLRVAEGLGQMGVAPGDRVAVIGPGIRAYWAWLARVRIVAEVPVWAVQDFWAADAQVQRAILDRFAEAGAKFVVYHPDTAMDQSVEAGAKFVGNDVTDSRSDAPPVPAGLQAMGWQRIEKTDYYVLRLKK